MNAQFRDFAKYMNAGARRIAGLLEQETDAVVEAGRQRPDNPDRHARDLADAIRASIAPLAVGRMGLGAGVRVTDEQTLNRIAAYWHAIEIGSSHLVGKPVRAFGRKVGGVIVDTSPADAARFRMDPDMAPRRAGSTGPIVRRPIEAHNYLGTISNRAITLFEREVGNRIQQVLS